MPLSENRSRGQSSEHLSTWPDAKGCYMREMSNWRFSGQGVEVQLSEAGGERKVGGPPNNFGGGSLKHFYCFPISNRVGVRDLAPVF